MENKVAQLLFWDKLTEKEKVLLNESILIEKYEKGAIIYRQENTCKGLMTVSSGQLRTYILSEEGREVTLFRVPANETCVLSASCLMESITFEVIVEAVEDTVVWIIPVAILNQIMAQNPYVELYLYKAATEKFSDVMWTMQQILFLRVDQRIAQFLWDEMVRKDSMKLHLTHDEIAKNIGSIREVVSKTMKYLAQENIIELGRGIVHIIQKEKLRKLI